MDDAPEWTPRWIGVPEEKYEELKAEVAALKQENENLVAEKKQVKLVVESLRTQLTAMEQEREWCPENPFATHGNDAEWVCDCYACNERRDALCDVQHLRAEVERLRAAILRHLERKEQQGAVDAADIVLRQVLHEGGNDG
jgi:hypothetical protein